MPMIDADGCAIHVEVEGPQAAPALMLSNSLGTTLAMWDDQVKPFAEHFRLVRYDRRGHGQSAVVDAPCTIERLGRDALAIMDGLKLETVNWCGLSIGGMVGMWLGANAPQRLDKLILSNTACHIPTPGLWDERIKTAREHGMAPLADPTLERWFTKEFREREPQTMARMRAMVLSTPPQGYVRCCEAIRDMDQRESISRIPVPTMIIAGRYDPATTLEAAEFIRARIAGSSMAVLDAAHISNVERPDEYARTVLRFLRPV